MKPIWKATIDWGDGLPEQSKYFSEPTPASVWERVVGETKTDMEAHITPERLAELPDDFAPRVVLTVELVRFCVGACPHCGADPGCNIDCPLCRIIGADEAAQAVS